MSLFTLKDIRNHPRRSAFDLSSKVDNRYFQEWKDKNYYEVHYIRVKHKKLNDENNVFLE